MQGKFHIFLLILLCGNSQVNAQRLTLPESRISSRYQILTSSFDRILHPLQNLVQQVTSRRIKNYDAAPLPPETFLSTPQIIRFHGYPVEEHKFKTQDGYIISIFRILHIQKNKSTGKREPVLIQHGLTCSSDDFLQLNHKDILPYLLADSGHNVWLGNIRGNTFGKQHSVISVNDSNFYNFTMDDLGRDIAEIIKYILKVENVPQLNYVCHSMGCTMISMAVSDHPELNRLIRKGSFMAPGTYLSHLSSPFFLTLFSFPESFLLAYSQRYARGRVVPLNLGLELKKYGPRICQREITRRFCHSTLAFLVGLNPGQITNETLVKVFGHFPADTSMNLFVQYLQFFMSKNFQKFDYGMEKNLAIYGSAKPPLYNLSRVIFPVQGFYGLSDNTISTTDALRNWRELGNVVETIQMEDEKWTHMDFLYGKDARRLVYDKIVQFLSA